MRILYLTTTMAIGGAETNIVGLARHLTQRGHAVVVVSSGGALVTELQAAGALHRRMRLSLRRPPAVLRAMLECHRLVSSGQFDVVHAMSAAGNMAVAFAPRRHSVFISSPMGLQDSENESSWVTALRNRAVVLRADRVLVISHEIERALLSIGVATERLIRGDVVGVDLERFAMPDDDARRLARVALRRELGLPDDVRLITTVGNLTSRKSHHLFVSAARLVLETVPDARFAIVGEGEDRPRLTAAIRDSGLQQRCFLIGARRDVERVLSASDVYVKPGIVEGFIGITVLEAMAVGVPIVAFDTNDVRAAITPEATGLLVPKADVEGLARAIERIIREPQLAQGVVRAAHERAQAVFGLGSVVDKLVLTYERVRNEIVRGAARRAE